MFTKRSLVAETNNARLYSGRDGKRKRVPAAPPR